MDDFLRFCKLGIPHNVLLVSLVILCLIVGYGLGSNNIKNKRRFSLTCILIEYILIVIGSTVIFRFTIPFQRTELIPFWDIYAIYVGIPGVRIWDIILNIVLFMPFGVILGLYGNNIKYLPVVCYAILLSMTIEISQFVFSKGIAQTDDMINNSIGAIIGFEIIKYIRKQNNS